MNKNRIYGSFFSSLKKAFVLAWRNIWRNKKRTFITISSIVLAVILAIFTRSFQEGTFGKMISNSIGQMTGYINIHQKDYWDDKTLDNGFEIDNQLEQEALSIEGVEELTYKLESFMLAAYKNKTKGAMLIGIDPESENKYSKLKNRIVAGNYIQDTDKSILIGSGLADYLNLKVGDTLVLMGQGHFGQSALGAFPVKGIVKLAAPNINKIIVYLPIKLSQELFSFPNGVTSAIVRIANGKQTESINAQLNESIDSEKYTAIDWKTMSPDLINMFESKRSGGTVMIGLLYMIIAFGILGTIIMMMEERRKEFAVMIAIGMQRSFLILIALLEMLYINLLGFIFGIGLTIPIVLYFKYNPIKISGEMVETIEQFGMEPYIPTAFEYSIFQEQILVLLGITVVISLFPIISVLRLKLIASLKK